MLTIKLTMRLRDGNGDRLQQVFRGACIYRGAPGNVRFRHGGGHYYRGRVSLEMTHSAKVAIRLTELVKPCLAQKASTDPIAFKSLFRSLRQAVCVVSRLHPP